MKSVLVTLMIAHAPLCKGYMTLIPNSITQFIVEKSYEKAPSINVKGLDLAINQKVLFNNADFHMHNNEVVTIVGENGCGKSSLLKIIFGQNYNYNGEVSCYGRVGILPQNFESLNDEIPALIHMLTINKSEEEARKLISDSEKFSTEWYKSINNEGAYTLFQNMRKIGLPKFILEKPFKYLSGGQKTKAILCSLSYANPDILLLDEPTNHLDEQGLNWLEHFIKNYFGCVLIVTHDRKMINNVSSRIAEISPHSKSFTFFKGGYKGYLEEQEKIRQRAIQSRSAQDDEVKILSDKSNRLSGALQKNVKRSGGDSDKLGFNARGERKQKGISSVVKQSNKKLDRILDNLVEVPIERKKMSFNFLNYQSHETSNLLISVDKLSFSFGNQEIFDKLSFSACSGERVILKGANGTGKTTLLKIIANKLQPSSGNIELPFSAKIGFLDQEQEFLDLSKSAFDLIFKDPSLNLSQAETLKLLQNFGIYNAHDLYSSLLELSIGCRRKAQLCHIVAHKPNILLLDEPTNHIDFPSLEVIEETLTDFPGILIAATHDRYFVEKVGTRIINLIPNTN